MKKAVTSVDIHYLVEELSTALLNARVDDVFESGERTLVFTYFKSREGKRDFVVAPFFLCISKFKRSKPKHPSSFVMQLRKNLKGCFVRGLRQHDFDRIVEIDFEGKEEKYTLVLEVFSKGNIVLLNEDRTIRGLFEWQKWRDRKLGVKQKYEYPPSVVNPLTLTDDGLADIFTSSERDVVRTLAVECGLGGLYAEEVCARSGVDKEKPAKSLGKEVETISKEFGILQKNLESHQKSPMIIFEDDEPIDVIPFKLKVYEGFDSKEFPNLNEPLDEYFSKKEFTLKKEEFESKYEKETGKLERRLSDQETALRKAREDAEVLKQKGDLLFARMHEIKPLLAEIKAFRKRKLSDQEVLAELGKQHSVKSLHKTELTINLDA